MTSNSSAIHLRPRRPKGPLVASTNPSSRCNTAVALKASGSGELAVGSSLRRKQSKAKRQQEQARNELLSAQESTETETPAATIGTSRRSV
ncbi:hypothetical protein KC343_g7284 [Hortaea werneckii]|nr:hypothetical protein KC317_g11235 [Hortaea werneckii]KAI7601408.1 hypothetical protein KC346_g12826 [Hortaea werneckii]KAI7623445.1 hypothetical protein KC343_g7284 [Hortaea werneckii]KAI7656601.1 hypothetical protein KC319_g9696 [Hortaea werneckii]KAI7691216.1 hypothetical protein KC322_g11345 [Hortaea werneckii]